jgi:hypothetical protein
MPDGVRHRAWVRRAIAATVGVLAAIAAIAVLSGDPLETGNKLASIGGLLVGAAGLIVAILSMARATASEGAEVAASLAHQVRRQWQREKHLRQLDGTGLIPVSWRSTTLDVAPPPAELLAGAVAGRPTALRLGGTIADLGETFRKLPHRRLVVLGEPGSGKSTLLLNLTIELLTLRSADDAVPVLLNLAAWDPREELESWLVRQLVEEYPIVALKDGCQRFVDDGKIIPVLDGLDEVPADLRTAALTSLGLFAATDQAFVISCRTTDYADIVASTGRPVAGAAVVEIDMLTAPVVTSYLDGSSWRPVREAIGSSPALRDALQTPLMLHLAKTIYDAPGADPKELLDTEKFATSEEIEDHLLAAYLPAVYEDPGGRRTQAAVARLSYLAKHTGENIAWWNLRDAVVRWSTRSAALASVIVVFFIGLPTTLLSEWRAPQEYGVVPAAAIVVGFVLPLMNSGGSRITLARSLLCIGLPAAVATAVTDGLSAGLAAVADGSVGLSFSELAYFPLTSVWAGLTYAISFELGQSMRDIASMPRPLNTGIIRRALMSCVLVALVVTSKYFYYASEKLVVITLAAFMISVVGCVLQAVWRRFSSAVAIGVPLALYSVSKNGHDGWVDQVLFTALMVLPAWLMVEDYLDANRPGEVDKRRSARRVGSVIRRYLLVFAVISTIVLVGGTLNGSGSLWENVTGALIAGVVTGAVFAGLGLSSAYLATPARDLDQTDPRLALRRDRAAAFVIIAFGAYITTVALAEPESPLQLGVILMWLLLFASSSRWPAYFGARVLLWLSRALPWRVTDFLADAHDRGVLRRTGSVYQFRHALIKNSLARSAKASGQGAGGLDGGE